jgi:L-asparaginase II
MSGPVLAHVIRSGFLEGVHHGSVLVLDGAGAVVAAAGDVESACFPRSSNKPAQAVGMLRSGWVGERPDVALAAASHSGEPFHVARVRALLAAGQVDESALGCPPDLPLHVPSAHAVLAAGGGPTRVQMNCSGKHAAMLRTCQAASWKLTGYLEPDHPLQIALHDAVEELASERIAATGIDGCGAPLFALSLHGLARTFLRLVDAPAGPERQVADAMREYPELVAGTGRDATVLMAGVPGLLAKDGAEGVYAVALPGIGAVALKIDDGAARARTPVLVSALRRLGVDAPVLDELAETPLLGGGKQVGAVHPAW